MPARPLEQFAHTPVSRVEAFWDARPCNIRHSRREPGTRAYFDEVERRKYFVEPHIPGFAQFDRWKGKKVLEIGCGIGTDTVNFARAGARVTAVDCSARSLEIARQRAAVYGVNVHFYKANAEGLSTVVPVETYDLIYSFGVIHHTPHPDRVIAEVLRYMGPQSLFKMMVYHRRSWKVLGILWTCGHGVFWKLDQWIAQHSEAQSGCPVTYSYTPATVRNLLKGLEVREWFVDHIFPYKVSDYVRYQYVKQWYFRCLPAQVFRWMERRWGWHLCVTAALPLSSTDAVCWRPTETEVS